MLAEQDKTLMGIQVAIQMEIDGKEYYLKASQGSSSPLGKELLGTSGRGRCPSAEVCPDIRGYPQPKRVAHNYYATWSRARAEDDIYHGDGGTGD